MEWAPMIFVVGIGRTQEQLMAPNEGVQRARKDAETEANWMLL